MFLHYDMSGMSFLNTVIRAIYCDVMGLYRGKVSLKQIYIRKLFDGYKESFVGIGFLGLGSLFSHYRSSRNFRFG